MNSNQALRPEFFAELPSVVKEQQAKSKGISEEEQHIYAMSQSAGWNLVKQFAKDLIADLERVTEISMQQGLSFEEIGRNALVASLSKGVIMRVLTKVSDAEEAMEKPDGTIKAD